MRQSWRPGFIPVGIVVLALAFTSASAQATGGARIAAGCPNETVNGVAGKVTLRFVLHGKVSCNKAHSLIRAYFRHVATGYCQNRGTACSFSFAGWDCALHVVGEHDGVAGCVRETPFATVTAYGVTRRASAAAEPSSFSIAGGLTAVAATSAAAKRSCGTELVQPGTIGPRRRALQLARVSPTRSSCGAARFPAARRAAWSKRPAKARARGMRPLISQRFTPASPEAGAAPRPREEITAACGADASGLPGTRRKSMGYSSSRWSRAAHACTPL
jgi:hypothetical protein